MRLRTDTDLDSPLTTIPEAVRNYLGPASGDRVAWHLIDGDVVVRPADGEATE